MTIRQRIFVAIIIIAATALFFIPLSPRKPESAKIIATNFVAYDFARATLIENHESTDQLKLLVPAGVDLHSFDPSPDDIVSIKQASAIIYTGGESDEWLEPILSDLPESTTTVRMFDFVEPRLESTLNILADNEEEGDEYDEHIWTSPKNAAKIINGIAGAINRPVPQQYLSRIAKLDQAFSELAIQPIVVADRFPLLYFVNDYRYQYLAAFSGCAEQAEPDPQTTTKLIDYIKQHGIKTIFTIELSDQKLAHTIAEATGANIKTLQSAHNLTADEFNSGITYADLFEQNLNTLKSIQLTGAAR